MNQSVINYRKSSDGLSGGAIAGIVVGGVAVIVAISVISIILIKRKIKPPEGNTTVNNIKTDINRTEIDKIDPKIYDPNKIDPKTYDPNKIDQKTYDRNKIDSKIDSNSKKDNCCYII